MRARSTGWTRRAAFRARCPQAQPSRASAQRSPQRTSVRRRRSVSDLAETHAETTPKHKGSETDHGRDLVARASTHVKTHDFHTARPRWQLRGRRGGSPRRRCPSHCPHRRLCPCHCARYSPLLQRITPTANLTRRAPRGASRTQASLLGLGGIAEPAGSQGVTEPCRRAGGR